MKGKIIKVKLKLKKSRLKIAARIETADGYKTEAYLPARELAALLPRQVLLGDRKKAHTKLLDTILPIITRLITGRAVRVWQHDGHFYFAFFPWNEIIFEDDPAGMCTSAASECQKQQPH